MYSVRNSIRCCSRAAVASFVVVMPAASLLTSCRRARHPAVSAAGSSSVSCPELRIPVAVVPVDSVGRAEACDLVARAIEAVRDAVPASGLLPGDASEVARASITPLTAEPAGDMEARPTWHITLSLPARPYDAEVIVDRRTDSLSVTRVHKPLGT